MLGWVATAEGQWNPIPMVIMWEAKVDFDQQFEQNYLHKMKKKLPKCIKISEYK